MIGHSRHTPWVKVPLATSEQSDTPDSSRDVDSTDRMDGNYENIEPDRVPQQDQDQQIQPGGSTVFDRDRHLMCDDLNQMPSTIRPNPVGSGHDCEVSSTDLN